MKSKHSITLSSPTEPGTALPVPQDPIRREFVLRVRSAIFYNFLGRSIYNDALYGELTSAVAHATKTPWEFGKNIGYYVGDDYDKCLRAVEACYTVLAHNQNKQYALDYDQVLLQLIQECCPGLGLEWESGHFT